MGTSTHSLRTELHIDETSPDPCEIQTGDSVVQDGRITPASALLVKGRFHMKEHRVIDRAGAGKD
jgi:hypothetical protein